MLVFNLVTIAAFLVCPSAFWRDGVPAATGVWLWIGIVIAEVAALDSMARSYIERRKWRFFTSCSNLANTPCRPGRTATRS